MGRLNKLKKEFFEVISFSSKYRPLTFLTVLILLTITPLNFLEGLPNLSICSRILGEKCYSVGITRGVSALLKGNLELAVSYNWISIPVLIVMVLIIFLDLIKKFKK